MEDNKKLVARMRHLVSLHDPERGGPYGGTAATSFVETMALAADRLDAEIGPDQLADLLIRSGLYNLCDTCGCLPHHVLPEPVTLAKLLLENRAVDGSSGMSRLPERNDL